MMYVDVIIVAYAYGLFNSCQKEPCMHSLVLTHRTQLLGMPGNSAQDLYADLVAEVCRTFTGITFFGAARTGKVMIITCALPSSF